MTNEIAHRNDDGYELDARLEKLAGEIGEGLTVLQDRWRATLDTAMEVGEKLIEAKSLVRHGQWLDWLEEHFRPACAPLSVACGSLVKNVM